jgi:hypothetical protein
MDDFYNDNSKTKSLEQQYISAQYQEVLTQYRHIYYIITIGVHRRNVNSNTVTLEYYYSSHVNKQITDNSHSSPESILN